jgi:hypothetical protein
MIIPAIYDKTAWDFENGLALVTEDGKNYIIDLFGNKVTTILKE